MQDAHPVNENGEKNYAFSLFNSVYGGAMSSRLFQKIREESGMAYSVYSYPNSYTDCGMLSVYAATNPENASGDTLFSWAKSAKGLSLFSHCLTSRVLSSSGVFAALKTKISTSHLLFDRSVTRGDFHSMTYLKLRIRRGGASGFPDV